MDIGDCHWRHLQGTLSISRNCKCTLTTLETERGIWHLSQRQMIKLLELSVQKQNYAVGMYKKVGFQIVDENDEEYIMVCRLS